MRRRRPRGDGPPSEKPGREGGNREGDRNGREGRHGDRGNRGDHESREGRGGRQENRSGGRTGKGRGSWRGLGRGRRDGNPGRDDRKDRGNRGRGDGRDRGRSGGRRDGSPAPRPVDDFWSRLIRDDGTPDFLEKTPCPACGGLPARIQGRLGPTLLRRCKACSLRYVSPRLATALREEILRREPSPLSSERNLQLRHKAAERMERMHREMPALRGRGQRSASLLEIGCRWGHFLQLCRPHYASVEGLEWSKERAAFARERFDLQVSATDIFRDPWEGRYDIVCAWDLIEREPHPLEFLRWAHAHLEPGGLVALSTANYDSLARRLARRRWYGFEPARRLCYFTPSVLKALLEQAGFTDVAIRTSGLAPLRDWFRSRNRTDRSLDARSQWLESLREREAREKARKERMTGIFRETAWMKIRNRLAETLSGFLTAPGWGDTIRVYARKP